MKRQEIWQAVLHAKRTPHQVQLQSQQIERAFARRDVAAQVTGGRVTSRQVQYDLQTSLENGLDLLRGLKQELLAVLGVSDVQFMREDGRFGLHITRPEESPVPLLEMTSLLPEIMAPTTAVLGLSEEGNPVLLELLSGDVGHALILGGPAAGKTTLLRTIAASLAMTNRQSQLQLLVMSVAETEDENEFSQLASLSYLPHLLEPVVFDKVNAASLLTFLVEEVCYRLEQEVVTPTIIILVDHLDSLLHTAGEEANDAMLYLLQHGSTAGVHLVMAASDPESEWLSPLIQAYAPVRIVGRVESEQANKATGGRTDTHPEYLLGEGDFLAIAGDEVTHFQAAFVSDYDLHLVLDTLHRNRPQPLLAQTVPTRSQVTDLEDEVEETIIYELKAAPAESRVLHEKVAPAEKYAFERDGTADVEVIPFEVGRTSYHFEDDDQEP